MGACEVRRWIALGMWNSAGGVVGSLSMPISSYVGKRSVLGCDREMSETFLEFRTYYSHTTSEFMSTFGFSYNKWSHEFRTYHNQ